MPEQVVVYRRFYVAPITPALAAGHALANLQYGRAITLANVGAYANSGAGNLPGSA
jgi:hypothetical protein